MHPLPPSRTLSRLRSLSPALPCRYEKLEEELDRTVLGAGALEGPVGGGGGGGEGGGGGGGSSSSLLLQPFLRVPSSSQRRMEQCLGLAKDLLTTQRRAEVAEAAAATYEREMGKLKEEVGELERRIQQGKQPQTYLADQVDVAERGRIEAQTAATALQLRLTETSNSLAAAQGQNELLLRDLELLLSQRGSLDALRATLTRLLPNELAPAIAA